MREYFITKSDLGYHVFRKKTENNFETVEWLQNNTYTLNRNHAKTFYHLDDAKGALVLARRRGDDTKETSEGICDSIPERRIEKQSRSEF